MKYSNKVMIEAVKEKTGRTVTANPHRADNVNQSQGPRTGNAAAREGKRATFKAEKEAKAPVAEAIARAFGARSQDDYVNKKLEPVASNTRGRKFS